MAEAEAPALPQDIMDEIRVLATDGFNYWKDNANEAQKAVGNEEFTKFTTDPAFLEQMTKDMNDAFEAAGPVDGRLDEAKYNVWINTIQDASANRGNFEDRRPEQMTKTYALLNRITPDSDGISMGDFNAVMGPWMAVMGECKAAAGL